MRYDMILCVRYIKDQKIRNLPDKDEDKDDDNNESQRWC